MKKIYDICLDCGKKGTKNKGSLGMWKGTCDLCGKKTWVASAQHDFGIYNNEKEKTEDEIQDLV